jgi:hypothetical protein
MPSIINATTTAGVAVTGDNSGALALQTNNGTTAVTITTAQRVGIGTTTPTTNLQVSGAGSGTFGVYNDPLIVKGSAFTYVHLLGTDDQAGIIYNRNGSTGWFTGLDNSGRLKFAYMSTMDQTGLTNAKDTGSPSLLLNTSGAVLINRTTQVNSERFAITGNTGSQCMALVSPITGAYDMCNINNGNGQVGVIQTNGTATSYVTSSDYRLKENVAPMTGALAKVALLKPCTYTWKVDGSAGQGFIAHELQAVVPDAVVGEKDAVETYTDEDGNEQTRIKPQGVDTSFLVATLTAAIQELKAELDATKAEVQALKGVA